MPTDGDKEQNPFYQRDFISIDQVNGGGEIDYLFPLADELKKLVDGRESVEHLLDQYSVSILFYQSSTRTFSSFLHAAQRLGGYVTAIHGMEEYSSVSKGENLPDTIRSINRTTHADAIVLRHPDDNSGEIAARFSEKPVVSGGSGKKEHPTQALLDLYTIYASLQTMDNLKVAMVGDLLYGRTIKSLAKLLAVVGQHNHLQLVSPEELKAPRDFLAQLDGKISYEELDSLEPVLETADVIYMTRVQKEWFEKQGELDKYERLKASMTLTREMADQMKEDAIIMHPLPRQEELRYGVDENPRAKYFDQMDNGLFVRMALLVAILRENPYALMGLELDKKG